jgi:hypothetical protein
MAEFITIRAGSITDWNFKPDYKIYFQGTEAVGTFGTTNWDLNVESFGKLSKSIKHWTGDFEIGEWNPSLADPINELYGSLYATLSESRYKEVHLRAMTVDKPLTYIPQYTGIIDETSWQDGILSLTLRDKIRDLPYRTFVWDYENLGTIKSDGREIGIVKKIVGTDVMFDDDGDINYIEVKSDGDANFSIVDTIVAGAIAFGGGNWVGAGFSVANSVLRGLIGGGGDTKTGYWKLTDFNIVPDGVIKTGGKIKFYPGSISGIATNSNNPLFSVKEFVSLGGTFRNTQFGFNGTVSFDDTRTINIGDYVYVRRPLIFSGNPTEIIKGILCGSNIDIPFHQGRLLSPIPGNFGVTAYYETNDFATNFDSELNVMNIFNLAKFISADTDTTPFHEVKELVRELQISFYVDEINRFSVRTIKPRNLISAGTEIHYREGVQILDGFKFTRSTQDALIGMKLYYNYVGQGVGAFLNGYGKLIEVKATNPIVGANQWGTIESKWIRLDEDAREIVYRTLVVQERGIDRINLPTTLYGIAHSITDIVRVTHRTGSLGSQLFELESYEKDFDNSRVNLTAVNLSRAYGYGNCIWTGTSIPVSNATQSGFNYMGFSGTGTRHGTFISANGFGTIPSWATYWDNNNFDLTAFGVLSNNVIDHLIAVGTSEKGYTEICHITSVFSEGIGFSVKRGMFNTIPRTYFPTDYFYDLGPVYRDVNGTVLPFAAGPRGTFVFGTSLNIATNIGTAFKFF